MDLQKISWAFLSRLQCSLHCTTKSFILNRYLPLLYTGRRIKALIILCYMVFWLMCQKQWGFFSPSNFQCGRHSDQKWLDWVSPLVSVIKRQFVYFGYLSLLSAWIRIILSSFIFIDFLANVSKQQGLSRLYVYYTTNL